MDKGMTREEFELELKKYPIVRDSNYQGSTIILANSNEINVVNNENSESQKEELVNNITFKDALFQRLEEKLGSPLMAEAASQSFFDSYQKFISKLSLDDIENLSGVLYK